MVVSERAKGRPMRIQVQEGLNGDDDDDDARHGKDPSD